MNGAALALDASPLHHFARAGELAALGDLLADFHCVTTKAVVGELENSVAFHPEVEEALRLDWLRVVPCDDLDVLYLFSEYANRLGNRRRNAGECSVLAWAEYHGAIAFVDDQVACEVGRSRGVEVRRTLGLVIKAARHGDLDEARAQEIVRNLVDANARLPSQAASDLFGWARVQNPPLI